MVFGDICFDVADVDIARNIVCNNFAIFVYGNVYYNFAISGNEISATVNVMLSAGSNQATATVNPNYNSSSLSMSGYIYPYNNAGIIEGTSGYY